MEKAPERMPICYQRRYFSLHRDEYTKPTYYLITSIQVVNQMNIHQIADEHFLTLAFKINFKIILWNAYITIILAISYDI